MSKTSYTCTGCIPIDKSIVDTYVALLSADKSVEEAEEARVEAEAGRVEAETARVSAEAERVIAERAREATSSADHILAASDHTTAVADHATAEGDHTTATSDHTASVDATEAAGVATTRANEAAAAAEHMVDIKTGPQGPQGNTGSSVDYPYELVNNVTTDDATKGLSAAQGVVLDGKISQLGQQVIYDVSANNDGATFASLSALLSSENLSTLIPIAVRCGGMSIKFVQTSDNKYVQYRLKSQTFDTDIFNWQDSNSVDTSEQSKSELDISDGNGYVIARFKEGHFETKEFNSLQNNANIGIDSVEEFRSDKYYYIDDVVKKDGLLYKFIQNHKAGAWNSSEVTTTNIVTNLVDIKEIENTDFDIADENGQIIIRLKDGDVQTKNFDSSYIYYDNLVGCFEKIACIGDSITAGFTDAIFAGQLIGSDTARLTARNWPSYFAKSLGIDVINLGYGSTSTTQWRNSTPETEGSNLNCCLELANIKGVQAYFVMLGWNDTVEVGTSEDIEADYNDNAQSFYGNYDNIVRRLHIYNPKAHIFVFTLPRRKSNSTYNNAIRYIADLYSSFCHLIECSYNKFFDTSFFSNVADQTHFSPLGYNAFSSFVKKKVSRYIYDNPDKFMGIPYTADVDVLGNTVAQFLTLTSEELSLSVGDYETVVAEIYPTTAINKTITWSIISGDNCIDLIPNVSTIYCTIKAVSTGSCTVKVMDSNGNYKTILIEVNN